MLNLRDNGLPKILTSFSKLDSSEFEIQVKNVQVSGDVVIVIRCLHVCTHRQENLKVQATKQQMTLCIFFKIEIFSLLLSINLKKERYELDKEVIYFSPFSWICCRNREDNVNGDVTKGTVLYVFLGCFFSLQCSTKID